jgi:hypothetical protein
MDYNPRPITQRNRDHIQDHGRPLPNHMSTNLKTHDNPVVIRQLSGPKMPPAAKRSLTAALRK